MNGAPTARSRDSGLAAIAAQNERVSGTLGSVKLRLWRRYNFKRGDRVVTWSPYLEGYHGTLVRKSRLPWSWSVEFDSDHVPGGKRQWVGQASLIPEELAPEHGTDDLFHRHFRKRR